jgi:hypothetical protein
MDGGLKRFKGGAEEIKKKDPGVARILRRGRFYRVT